MELFLEEENGQLCFFTSEQKKCENQGDSFKELIQYSRKGVLKFQKEIKFYEQCLENHFETTVIEKIKRVLKEEMDKFIKQYFDFFNKMDYEEVSVKYSDYATDYHNLGKLFLNYLDIFIFKQNIVEGLYTDYIIEMENFILNDWVPYRSIIFKENIIKINHRKKLRVNHYILYDGASFLEKMKELEKNASFSHLGRDVFEKVQYLLEDKALKQVIFDEQNKEILNTKSKEVLCILFLHYLEKCIYFNSFEWQNSVVQSLNQQIEWFVVKTFSHTFFLSEREEGIFQVVRKNVGRFMQKYIEETVNQIFRKFNDYRFLENFKQSGKYQLISIQEDFNHLPDVVSLEELKFSFESFLDFCFFQFEVRENSPLFLEELEREKHKVMEIILLYLWYFVYKEGKKRKNKIEDEKVVFLEHIIASDSYFHVDGLDLCAAKSLLLERENIRNTLDRSLLRKKLQTL